MPKPSPTSGRPPNVSEMASPASLTPSSSPHRQSSMPSTRRPVYAVLATTPVEDAVVPVVVADQRRPAVQDRGLRAAGEERRRVPQRQRGSRRRARPRDHRGQPLATWARVPACAPRAGPLPPPPAVGRVVRAVPPPPVEGRPGRRQLLTGTSVTGLVFLEGADGEADRATPVPPPARAVPGRACPGTQSVDATRCSQERQSDQLTPSTHRCQPCQFGGAAAGRSPPCSAVTLPYAARILRLYAV